MRSQTLIISGTHRSGTSLSADLLRQAGVHIGDRLLGPAAGNPRGHFEDRDFYELHERALRRQGRDFLLTSTDGLEGFDAAERAHAETLIAARRERALWGWKDPRTVFFLADWECLLSEVRFFFVYRHPVEVVLSLLRRASDLQIAADPMRGVRMWEAYNRVILDVVRRRRTDAVLMALPTLVADERAAIGALAERLHLPLRPEAIQNGHVAAELHHGLVGADVAAAFAAFAPSAAALLAELDAEATPARAVLPRAAEAASTRRSHEAASFDDFMARLDPAAVRASRDALLRYQHELAQGLDARLRAGIAAAGVLERRAAEDAAARAAAEARGRALAERVRQLEARNEALHAEIERSPLRRIVRVARRVARALGRERPAPPHVPAPVAEIGDPVVLFVSHDAHRHGAQLLLLHLLRWIRRATDLRFEIVLKDGGALASEFELLAPTHDWTRDAAALAQRRNVRLVYANTITNGDVLAGLAPLACPVLTHVHELEHWIRHHVPPAALREVVQRTSRWIAVSRGVRDTLVDVLAVPPASIELVYEFLGPEMLRTPDAAETERARTELGIPADAWIVGGSGTMDWRKGADLFVQLAAALRRREGSRPVHCVWLGGVREGDACAKLVHDARAAGVADRVHFPGTVTDPEVYTACFDVFALVSREDPFPLVALEAAAQRVPVVCFAGAGGAPELVEGACGWVVPYLDVEAMAERVLHLLAAPDERRVLGERGAARVRAEHTVEVAGPRLVAVIEALAKPLAAAHPGR